MAAADRARILRERARILHERARALARPAGAEAAPASTMELLAFSLAHERYAVETRYVREVCPLTDLTRVPCTPPFVLGIINVRGELCPVIDLKRLLGLPERGLSNATRAVILRSGAREFGILADVVGGVSGIAQASIRPPPAALQGIHGAFLAGVTDGGVIVLDAERVIGHPAMVVREEVGAAPMTAPGASAI